MWRWLTVAALAYGIIAVWFAMSPRGTALGRFLEMVELQKGWQTTGQVPEFITFEYPVPEFQTVPPTRTEVIHVTEGQHVLRWEPDPSQPVNALAIPRRPDLVEATGIELRFRGEGVACIATGVKERDGSLYSRLHPVGTEWQQVRLDLAELRLESLSEDENDRLDPNQIEGMFIAVLSGDALRECLPGVPPRLRRQLKRRLNNLEATGQPHLDIDDIGIMGKTAPGPGSPPDGETGQPPPAPEGGFGPGGEFGPGGPGQERPRPQPGEGHPAPGEGDPDRPPREGQPGDRPPHGEQPRSADGEVTSVEGVPDPASREIP